MRLAPSLTTPTAVLVSAWIAPISPEISCVDARRPPAPAAGAGAGGEAGRGVCSPAGQHPVCRAGASGTSPHYADSMSPERRPPDVDDECLTVAEVAETLKLNQQTIRNWVTEGSLPALRVVVGRRVPGPAPRS